VKLCLRILRVSTHTLRIISDNQHGITMNFTFTDELLYNGTQGHAGAAVHIVRGWGGLRLA